MSVAKRVSKKNKPSLLSDRMKKRLLIGAGCVALVVGGWFAYFRFTTLTPPNLEKADVNQIDEVVSYCGDPRGLIRLPVDRQEQFLTQMYHKFSQGEPRTRLVQGFNEMSSSEREVMQAAIFEITRKHVAQMSQEYMSTPPQQRAGYIDKAIRNLESMGDQVSGRAQGEGRGADMSVPLKQGMPIRKEELPKMLVTRTDSQERTKAEPFINAMADRYKQLKDPEARKQFDGG